MEQLVWHTEQRKWKDLIPWEPNPRQMTKKEAEDLETSIEKFNIVEIPALDVNNTTISGHQRAKIMMMANKGEEVTDVRIPNRKLTEDEIAELNLRMNKNHGSWDLDLLSSFDTDLLLNVGFTDEELSSMFQLDMAPEPAEGEDDIPEPPAEPKSKLGDLYQLGRHRLLCGDSTKREDVERLMGGEKADMVFTDPPYGMALDTNYKSGWNAKKGHSKGIGGSDRRCIDHKSVIGDDKPFDPLFILDYFNNIKEIFLWGADYYCQKIPINGSWIVWDKCGGHETLDNTGFNSNFELCWSKQKHKREIARITYKGVVGMTPDDGHRMHPTQKSIKLVEWFLNKYSQENQSIADLFGGSGSTLIACEKTNRRCFMMEIAPVYIDVCVTRVIKFNPDIEVLRNGEKIDKSIFLK